MTCCNGLRAEPKTFGPARPPRSARPFRCTACVRVPRPQPQLLCSVTRHSSVCDATAAVDRMRVRSAVGSPAARRVRLALYSAESVPACRRLRRDGCGRVCSAAGSCRSTPACHAHCALVPTGAQSDRSIGRLIDSAVRIGFTEPKHCIHSAERVGRSHLRGSVPNARRYSAMHDGDRIGHLEFLCVECGTHDDDLDVSPADGGSAEHTARRARLLCGANTAVLRGTARSRGGRNDKTAPRACCHSDAMPKRIGRRSRS